MRMGRWAMSVVCATAWSLGAATAAGAAAYPVPYSFRGRRRRGGRPSGHVAARRQRLDLPPERRASVPGGPGARHLRRHDRQLAGALAVARRTPGTACSPSTTAAPLATRSRRQVTFRPRRRSRVVRLAGGRRHRRTAGRHRRPLAGRDDASLVPEVPRRRAARPHARRLGAVEPRHDVDGLATLTASSPAFGSCPRRRSASRAPAARRARASWRRSTPAATPCPARRTRSSRPRTTRS